MKIHRLVFSPIEVNTYVIEGESNECIIIDCGCYGTREETRLENFLSEHSLKAVMLLCTHCHLDHIFGNGFILNRYNLRSFFHEAETYNHSSSPDHARMFGLKMDPPPAPAGHITDGQQLTAAGLGFQVLHVPGHSPGGVAFHFPEQCVLFTGDALFAGSIGRSDLPGGNHEQLLESINRRIFVLPGETRILPGHGPETTVEKELKTNPFFVR